MLTRDIGFLFWIRAQIIESDFFVQGLVHQFEGSLPYGSEYGHLTGQLRFPLAIPGRLTVLETGIQVLLKGLGRVFGVRLGRAGA